MSHWFLDALDARAGIAFASFRDADLDDEDLDLDAPAMLVAAPHFRPESLSTRATGFAAASGSAQLGFVAGGAEVAFPSLDALIEFVRRLYIAGGSGDGEGGIGPGPPGPPDGGEGPGPGPEMEPPESGGGVRALMGLAVEFAGAAEGLALEQIRPRPRTARGGSGDHERKPAQLAGARAFRSNMATANAGGANRADLAAGVAVVLGELVRRAARRDASPVSWHLALQSLRATILKLGLMPALTRDRIGKALLDELKVARKHKPDLFGWPPGSEDRPDDFLLSVLLGLMPHGAYFDDHWDYWYYCWRRIGGPPPAWPGRAGDDQDPFDELSVWPLPATLAGQFGLEGDDECVRGLLGAVIADPSLLVRASKTGRVAAMLVLLGAVHLVARVSPADAGIALDPNSEGLVEAIVRDALSWLDRQAPRQAFAAELERTIADVRRIRYAAAGA